MIGFCLMCLFNLEGNLTNTVKCHSFSGSVVVAWSHGAKGVRTPRKKVK